jgi:hypothetical protein
MFLMLVRGGGPWSGLVSTGFFCGLTLGRVVLVKVTKKVNTYSSISGNESNDRVTDGSRQRHLQLYPRRDIVSSVS